MSCVSMLASQRTLSTSLAAKLVTVIILLLLGFLAATYNWSQASAAPYGGTQEYKFEGKTVHRRTNSAESFSANPQMTLSRADRDQAQLDKEASRQAAVTKEAFRQAELDVERKLISRQAKPVRNVVYFNHAGMMANMGCPAPHFTDTTKNYTCLYHNPSAASMAFLPDIWPVDRSTGCAAVFRPLPADFGRPWCIQKTAATAKSVRAALKKAQRQDMLHLHGMTLLLGMTSGPNPTHQLNIHFYHVYVWMKQNGIQMGDLNIVVDCEELSKCLGAYGIGLANAFGTLYALPHLPPITTFDRVKFSLSVGFPFDIHKYELDKALDCSFLELTWAVKQHYAINPSQSVSPKRVVIAVRRSDESRRLSNADDLFSALQSQGFNASFVTFGELTFTQQLQAVSDAAVLVGVTGSDLINLVFLPITGSVVEIFPVAQGNQVFTPELWNLAHMLGKNHLKYVSPYNSTLMLDSEGHLLSDRPVHQVKATDVHVPSLVALIEAASIASDAGHSVWNRMSIKPHSSGNGIKCWDRTRTDLATN